MLRRHRNRNRAEIDPRDMDANNAPDADMDLGPCCVCRVESKLVRNIICLPFRGPSPGKGWGCAQCGLPADGALAVICDDCRVAGFEQAQFKDVCVGYVKDKQRLPYANLRQVAFIHDAGKHPETAYEGYQKLSPEAGPTGEFPRGRLNAEDEGELKIAIARDTTTNTVIVDFGTPTKWLAMPPEQALQIGSALIEKAQELMYGVME